jgi:ribosome-binding ATPase YchF (GTP1/OBG family)
MLIGIVGHPNTGKSTFFKACTLANVAIAPFPFTTIKPNQGIGYVKVECPEKKIGKKCKPNHGFCLHGERFVPVKLIDVAGLVPEAYLGKGRGNEFLNELIGADLLIHVLDASGKTNEHGEFAENYPIENDVVFLEKEIDFWLKGILTKNWKELERKVQSGIPLVKEISRQLSGLKIKEEDVEEIMKKLKLNEKGSWSENDLYNFSREIRKKSKPMIIAANKYDLKESEKNTEELKNKFPSLLIIPCCSDYEVALREASKAGMIDYVAGETKFEIKAENLSESQKKALEKIKEFLERKKTTGIQECLNRAVFDFLNYIVVYPVENEHHFSDSKGNILPDAFLLAQNSTALDLAFAIHTDIGNRFIGAIDCKTGKRLGKDNKLKSGDIIKILAR